MTQMRRVIMAAFVGLLAFSAAPAAAEVVHKSGTFAGTQLDYLVVLPDGFDPGRTYPAVLAFAGGSQSLEGTRRALENHWVREAERRGYIVVSPAAPDGRLFFRGGAVVFPEFLDMLLSEYNVEGGQFHIAGRSNGGLSTFHVATLHPEYFKTVTGFPGYLQPTTTERLNALRGKCIYLHVGEFDSGWRRAMEQQADLFRSRGLPTFFMVEAGMHHGLDSLAGEGSGRLFDHFDNTGQNCK